MKAIFGDFPEQKGLRVTLTPIGLSFRSRAQDEEAALRIDGHAVERKVGKAKILREHLRRLREERCGAAQPPHGRKDDIHFDSTEDIQTLGRMYLPPIEEQRRVAAKLGAVVSKIAALRESAEGTRQEVRATLDSAFHTSISGAPRVAMGEIAPIVRRPVEIDPDKAYTEIGVRSFYKGIFHRRTVQGSQFTWQKLFRIAKDDLVFSNLMAWEQAIALATPADDGCVGNHRMLTCEADRTRCLPMFLWYYFRTPEGLAKVVAASPGSIARNKTLSGELLPNITVPVPTLDAQEWFESLHVKAYAIERGRAEVEQALSALMPSLLHDAFG